MGETVLSLENTMHCLSMHCRYDCGKILPLILLTFIPEFHTANVVVTNQTGPMYFVFLSSLPLLTPAATAVFGSYLSSLYS